MTLERRARVLVIECNAFIVYCNAVLPNNPDGLKIAPKIKILERPSASGEFQSHVPLVFLDSLSMTRTRKNTNSSGGTRRNTYRDGSAVLYNGGRDDHFLLSLLLLLLTTCCCPSCQTY